MILISTPQFLQCRVNWFNFYNTVTGFQITFKPALRGSFTKPIRDLYIFTFPMSNSLFSYHFWLTSVVSIYPTLVLTPGSHWCKLRWNLTNMRDANYPEQRAVEQAVRVVTLRRRQHQVLRHALEIQESAWLGLVGWVRARGSYQASVEPQTTVEGRITWLSVQAFSFLGLASVRFQRFPKEGVHLLQLSLRG